MSKEIALTKGLVAIVDDEDYPRLARYSWSAGGRLGSAYAVRRGPRALGQPVISMHREIIGVMPSEEVDHINGDRLDNRRANLRVATHAQNAVNAGLRLSNRSGFKGVSWCRRTGRWQVHIQVSGRSKFLGRFIDLFEAARAYDKEATRHFGQFAKTNASMGLLP